MITPETVDAVVVVTMASIVRPELDARIDRADDELEALGRDMLLNGQIEPIKLVRVGDTFEIVDGYSRFLAAQRVGMDSIRAIIYPEKTLALEGLKYRANTFRLAMSAADEAVLFHQLLTNECDGDIEKLARLVNQKIPYIDNRLELLAGDELVFDALRRKDINVGVARELNKITDPQYRRYYLKFAIQDGAKVSTVTGWVQDWKRNFVDVPQAPPPPDVELAMPVVAQHDPHTCYVCRKSDPRFIPETVLIHTHCKYAVLDKLLGAYHGDGE